MTSSFLIAFNKTRGLEVARKIVKADTWDSRSRGLLGRKALSQDEGMWIIPCAMIHMFFMKFAIDAVFLDRQNRVVRVFRNLKPWRATPWVWGANSVLELADGAADQLSRGDVLEFMRENNER